MFSYSRIQTFENCPFNYRKRYIERVKPETDGIEAFMGSRIHEALEALYRDARMGKIKSLPELLDLYKEDWVGTWHDKVNIVNKNYSADDYYELGREHLSDYYARYHPFNQTKTVDLEKKVTIKIGGGKYDFLGYIDRLALVSDDEFEIHDYKSSKTLPSQASLDSDWQLPLYQIGVERMWPKTKKVHLIWHYLAFDQEMRSYRTPAQLVNLEDDLVETVERIEAATRADSFEARESNLCSWCDYQELCSKRRHVVAVEKLSPNEHLLDDGVKIVDRYAELEAERRVIKGAADERMLTIEKELEKVKEAAAAFALESKADILAGSEHLLKIKTVERDKYPVKGDPKRLALDDILKKAGLWLEIADLNSASLTKLIKSGGLAPEVVVKVEEFKRFEKSQSFSLSKQKLKEKATYSRQEASKL